MIKFKVDEKKVIENIQRMVDLSKTFAPILMVIRGDYGSQNPDTIIGGINKNFATQNSPKGGSWSDLSPRYADQKMKKWGYRPMLIASGQMFDSIVNGGIDGVNQLTPTSLKYGLTGRSGEIGGYHMSGTNKMPSRKFMGIRSEQIKKWNKLIASYVLERNG